MRNALLAVLLALAAPAAALQPQTATTGAEFLRLGAGARALGMGEAYAPVAEGPDAAYWNPAGLGALDRPEVAYSRSELPAGTHHDFLAAAFPTQLLAGTFAVAVTRLSEDSLPLVNATNQTVGTFAPHSEAYAFAYGHRFASNDVVTQSRDYFREDWNLPRADRPFQDFSDPWTGEISAGVAIKGISETLGTRSASSFAVDAGGLFRPADLRQLSVAGTIRNVGERIRFITDAETLPVEAALGAAWDQRTEDWRLLPALEFDFPYAGNPYGKLGFEATTRVAAGADASLRVGYDSRSVPDLGPLSGLTAGVGLRVGSFRFDAAFQPMSFLGESFRIGAGWRF